MFALIVYVQLFVALLSCFVSSHPHAKRKHQPPPFDNTLNYLTRFGYLPESNMESGNLMSDDQLKNAIKNLQHFANIPETGIIDRATKEMMKKPRCGLPDIPVSQYSNRKKRYTVHGQKWHKTNLTWSLRTRWPGHLDVGRLRADLHRALHVWSKHSRLSFREINSDSADILVYFERGYHGDGYPFDGRGQILAHAFFPGSGRGGDAHFDVEEMWLLTGDDNHDEGTSLFAVAAHEFGHSLGLSHSSVPGALMYPWYQGLKPNFDLPEDDKHGIQQIYGPKFKEWGKNIHGKGRYPDEIPYRPPPRPPPPPPPTTSRTTTTTTTRRTTTTTYRPRVTTRRPENKPDACNTVYDAISLIRGDTFMFRKEYVWRVGDRGPYPGYPALTKRLWTELPDNFTRVDAVYERLDKKIVFFIGKLHWVYDGNRLEPEYPLPLTYLGLPASLDRVDAAMVWGHNSKTYLFSGTMYWRMDEEVGRVELDYPRDMARVWKGVPYYIDAVMQWKDGATYFFKGKGYWKFDDIRMRVEGDEKASSVFWMGCQPDDDDDNSFAFNQRNKNNREENETIDKRRPIYSPRKPRDPQLKRPSDRYRGECSYNCTRVQYPRYAALGTLDESKSMIIPRDRPTYKYNEGLTPSVDGSVTLSASAVLLAVTVSLHLVLSS